MKWPKVFTAALVTIASAYLATAKPISLELEDAHLEKRASRAAKFGITKTVRGVNLGGWFVLEAWMMPDLFTKDLTAKGAIDQWTYMTAVGDNTKALSLLQNHWSTWITQDDFAQIKAAGLNTVRIPVGHWTFNATSLEPYLAGAEQPYIAQALLWAKQYSLDVVLDMHTAPNSQNGFDNSGRQGAINFAKVNATQNAARLNSALVKMIQLYINDKQFGGVVKAVEILNEPMCSTLGQDYMTSVNKAAYTALRAAINSSAVTFPTTLVHDCFIQPLSQWQSTYSDTTFWKKNSMAIDTHRYQAWAPQNSYNFDQHISYTCGLASEFSTTQTNIRPTVVGEWSLGIGCTNCSFPSMADNINAMNNATQNLFFRRFFEAQVTTYEKASGWIFWNWKTQSRGDWSYKDAMAQGWIPKDPTTRVFKQTNSCPTTTLLKNVTFATTSYPPTVNTTSSSTSTSVSSSSSSSSSSSTSTNTAKTSTSTQAVARRDGPLDLGNLVGPFAGGLLNLTTIIAAGPKNPQALGLQLIPSTGRFLNINAFPFLKSTTFASGPSH